MFHPAPGRLIRVQKYGEQGIVPRTVIPADTVSSDQLSEQVRTAAERGSESPDYSEMKGYAQ